MTKSAGVVYLVGAGPGDPRLITLAGLELLQQADCVVYDKLVPTELLQHAPQAAERVYVGKEAGGDGRCSTPQESINALLIDRARQGRKVVRLKGGDALLFARGGEEAEALAAAGVRYEIVPGVTSALAAAATTGIPLTHRQLASAVAFVTGHEDPSKEGGLDWNALAKFPGTLVFYMALSRRRAVAQRLIECGKDGATLATFVEWAATNRQRVVETTLLAVANPTELDPVSDLKSPVLAVVGPVAGLRAELQWFEKRPLFGQRILVLRPPEQAGELTAKLERLGAQTVVRPAFTIHPPEDWRPVDASIRRLSEFDWVVFTSRNGVDWFLNRIWELGGDSRSLSRAKLAAIGPATSAALERWRLRSDVVPGEYVAEGLADALVEQAAGKRVLLVRANRGRTVLQEELTAAGAQVETIVTYRQVDVDHADGELLDDLHRGAIDWVLFSSSAMSAAFFRWLPPELVKKVRRDVRLATISPITTSAVRAAGYEVHAEAKVYTMDGMVDAVVRAVTSSSA